jgi:hypothetical protein
MPSASGRYRKTSNHSIDRKRRHGAAIVKVPDDKFQRKAVGLGAGSVHRPSQGTDRYRCVPRTGGTARRRVERTGRNDEGMSVGVPARQMADPAKNLVVRRALHIGTNSINNLCRYRPPAQTSRIKVAQN